MYLTISITYFPAAVKEKYPEYTEASCKFFMWEKLNNAAKIQRRLEKIGTGKTAKAPEIIKTSAELDK